MLVSKLKDFFKHLNFVSECCNNSSTTINEDRNLVQRIEKLEKAYIKCVTHQTKIREEISDLMAKLKRLRASSSSGDSSS